MTYNEPFKQNFQAFRRDAKKFGWRIAKDKSTPTYGCVNGPVMAVLVAFDGSPTLTSVRVGDSKFERSASASTSIDSHFLGIPSSSNATISPSKIVERSSSWLTASPMVGNFGSSGNRLRDHSRALPVESVDRDRSITV
jgi:hypothetical protein